MYAFIDCENYLWSGKTLESLVKRSEIGPVKKVNFLRYQITSWPLREKAFVLDFDGNILLVSEENCEVVHKSGCPNAIDFAVTNNRRIVICYLLSDNNVKIYVDSVSYSPEDKFYGKIYSEYVLSKIRAKSIFSHDDSVWIVKEDGKVVYIWYDNPCGIVISDHDEYELNLADIIVSPSFRGNVIVQSTGTLVKLGSDQMIGKPKIERDRNNFNHYDIVDEYENIVSAVSYVNHETLDIILAIDKDGRAIFSGSYYNTGFFGIKPTVIHGLNCYAPMVISHVTKPIVALSPLSPLMLDIEGNVWVTSLTYNKPFKQLEGYPPFKSLPNQVITVMSPSRFAHKKRASK